MLPSLPASRFSGPLSRSWAACAFARRGRPNGRPSSNLRAEPLSVFAYCGFCEVYRTPFVDPDRSRHEASSCAGDHSNRSRKSPGGPCLGNACDPLVGTTPVWLRRSDHIVYPTPQTSRAVYLVGCICFVGCLTVKTVPPRSSSFTPPISGLLVGQRR
jgi:hypothetical protein